MKCPLSTPIVPSLFHPTNSLIHSAKNSFETSILTHLISFLLNKLQVSTIKKHKSYVHFRNLFANFVVLCQIQVELLASGITYP